MNTPINIEISEILLKKYGVLLSNTSDVVMWLFEKHNVWIQVHRWTNQPVDDEVWMNCFAAYVNGDNMDAAIFKTPIAAYEAAIEYTLKNLI